MADWQRKLELKDEWPKTRNGELSVSQLADIVADRLEALEPFGDKELDRSLDYEREEIIEEFRALAEDADVDDFDEVLERLYDWADTPMGGGRGVNIPGVFSGILAGKKACWVATF